MTEKTPCCPQCRGTDLKLIGGVWVGTQGTDYVGVVDKAALLKLIESGGSFTRELMFCTTCDTRCLLADAKEAAQIVTKDYLWQGTDVGTTVPIICPECQNSVDFIRDVTRLGFFEEEVIIENGEIKTTVVATSDIDDEIVTAFRCGLPECSGQIILHKDTHALKSI